MMRMRPGLVDAVDRTDVDAERFLMSMHGSAMMYVTAAYSTGATS